MNIRTSSLTFACFSMWMVLQSTGCCPGSNLTPEERKALKHLPQILEKPKAVPEVFATLSDSLASDGLAKSNDAIFAYTQEPKTFKNQKISRVSLQGGAPTVFLQPVPFLADEFKVFGPYLYWKTPDSYGRMPTQGGKTENFKSSMFKKYSVSGDELFACQDGKLFKTKIGSSKVTQLMNYEGFLCEISVDETHVYFQASSAETTKLYRMAKDGSGVKLLIEDAAFHGFVVGNNYLYWGIGLPLSEEDAGAKVKDSYHDFSTIVKMPKEGGKSTVIVKNELQTNVRFVDETWIYWTSNLGLRRAPKKGGSAELLVADEAMKMPWESNFVTTDTHIYWFSTDSKLMRVAKKQK
jgi:hypothetical protein